MKTHRSMSRVREKAGLLRLLSGLAFLFFWSIEASKHCCWRQNKRCDFRTFFRFSDFILSQKFSNKIFLVALGEWKKKVWYECIFFLEIIDRWFFSSVPVYGEKMQILLKNWHFKTRKGSIETNNSGSKIWDVDWRKI